MKNKKTKIAFLIFALLAVGFGAKAEMPKILSPEEAKNIDLGEYYKESATKNSASVPGRILANINLSDGLINSQKEGIVKATFFIENLDQYVQPGVKFGLRLIQQKDGQAEMIDEKIFDETLTLKPKQKLEKTALYDIPRYLSGQFDLWAVSQNIKGLDLGQVKLGQLDLLGNGQYLHINRSSCSVESEGAAVEKANNVFIDQNKKGFSITCEAENLSNQDQSVRVGLAINKKTSFGDQAYSGLASGDVILVRKNSKQMVKFSYSESLPDYLYNIQLGLYDDKINSLTSNLVDIPYFSGKAVPTITNLRLDKVGYSKGEKGRLLMDWESFGANEDDWEVSFQITTPEGDVCASELRQQISSEGKSSENISKEVFFEKKCENPVIKVKITDDAGQVLDEATFKVFSIEKQNLVEESSKPSNSRTKMVLGLTLAVLCLVLFLLFHTKKRKEKKYFWSLLLVLLAFGLGRNVYALTFEACYDNDWQKYDGVHYCNEMDLSCFAACAHYTVSLDKSTYTHGENPKMTATINIPDIWKKNCCSATINEGFPSCYSGCGETCNASKYFGAHIDPYIGYSCTDSDPDWWYYNEGCSGMPGYGISWLGNDPWNGPLELGGEYNEQTQTYEIWEEYPENSTHVCFNASPWGGLMASPIICMSDSTKACLPITIKGEKGQCGSAAKQYSEADTVFSGTFCAKGTLSPAGFGNDDFPEVGGKSAWQCLGIDGGANAVCEATRVKTNEKITIRLVDQATSGVLSIFSGTWNNAIKLTSYPAESLNATFSSGVAQLQGDYVKSTSRNLSVDTNPPAVANYQYQSTQNNCGTSLENLEECTIDVKYAAIVPINGACGSAAGIYQYDTTAWPITPTQYCSSGSPDQAPNFPQPGTQVSWNCVGSGGGISAFCTATRKEQLVNGACGSAAKTYSPTESFPDGAYCSAGSASPSLPDDPKQGSSSSWVCQGSGGGLDENCVAQRLVPITCGPANDQRYCSKPKIGLCSDGSIPTVDSSNPNKWTWMCGGYVQCEAVRKCMPWEEVVP